MERERNRVRGRERESDREGERERERNSDGRENCAHLRHPVVEFMNFRTDFILNGWSVRVDGWTL